MVPSGIVGWVYLFLKYQHHKGLKMMEISTVLILNETDIRKSIDKSFGELTLCDFKIAPGDIEHHGLILYISIKDNKCKVLKSRYGKIRS